MEWGASHESSLVDPVKTLKSVLQNTDNGVFTSSLLILVLTKEEIKRIYLIKIELSELSFGGTEK
jgi:hypothetical protein